MGTPYLLGQTNEESPERAILLGRHLLKNIQHDLHDLKIVAQGDSALTGGDNAYGLSTSDIDGRNYHDGGRIIQRWLISIYVFMNHRILILDMVVSVGGVLVRTIGLQAL